LNGLHPGPAASRTALDWMELHLRCLYHHDAAGRIVAARQPGGRSDVLFHLARTPLGNLWRFGARLEPGLVSDLARLAGREPALSSPLDEPPPAPERAEALRRSLSAVFGPLREWRGPAYRFPDELCVPAGELPLQEVTPARAALLRAGFADWLSELADRRPCIAACQGETAVSLCCSSRPVEVPGSASCPAAEAGVETLPARRGEGHACRVVAAWALAVRASGAEPMYSTSWDNHASRAVARKLGLSAYGEDLHFSTA
jgi:hypothetical protein